MDILKPVRHLAEKFNGMVYHNDIFLPENALLATCGINANDSIIVKVKGVIYTQRL